MAKNRQADLHLHTTYSDGLLAPAEVIERAAAAGLGAVAITDHDDIGALDEARRRGQELAVEVIVGVELSTNLHGRDLHLLGYLFDPEHSALIDYLRFCRMERVERVKKILAKLGKLQMTIPLEEVLQRAGTGSVGRPHVADALLKAGYVSSFQQAFDRYLADDQPAFVAKFKISPKEAIDLVHAADGLTSMAHPGLDTADKALEEVVADGLDAIEVVHPQHNTGLQAHYRALAKKYNLLETGGSDFHGGRKGNDTLGRFTVDLMVVDRLKMAANSFARERG